MIWVYISPHLDDVALACGGLVWEQVQRGEHVSILTICAGNQPSGPLSPFAEEIHARSGIGAQAIEQRRSEDIASCRAMNATYCHLNIPDAIYHRNKETGAFLYTSATSLMGGLNPSEAPLVEQLASILERWLPKHIQLVCPLGLGEHADHILARAAVEKLSLQLWYYTDYPYVLLHKTDINHLSQTGWTAEIFPISAQGIVAWQEAVVAHVSQIGFLGSNIDNMRSAIATFARRNNGVWLWKRPRNKQLHRGKSVRSASSEHR